MIKDIICLCLDKRQELWEQLEKNCAEKIPGAEFHKFIVGNGFYNLRYDYIDLVDQPPLSWSWGWGQSALRHYHAFCSHKEMIKRAIAKNMDNFLLLEDDACVLSRYNDIMSQIQLPQEWDIIYLGWHAFEYDNHKFSGENLIIENKYKLDGKADLVQIGQCGGLFAALINNTLYKKILRLPELMPIDAQLNRLKIDGEIKAYNVVPMSIYTKSGISNCEGFYIERDLL